jgi:hypothetical protein
MMPLFRNHTLGRKGYVIMIFIMVAFDFAKTPIERLSMVPHDMVAQQLSAPRPLPKSDIANQKVIVGDRNMPLMFEGQAQAVDAIVKSGKRPTDAEIEAFRQETIKSILYNKTNGNTEQDGTSALVAGRTILMTLQPMVALALTALTIVGLLWMLSGRLRDIGWPPALMYCILAPVFLPKLLGVTMPPLAETTAIGLFYGAIVLLALPPFPEKTRTEPEVAPVTLSLYAPRKGGQFGKLGSK